MRAACPSGRGGGCLLAQTLVGLSCVENALKKVDCPRGKGEEMSLGQLRTRPDSGVPAGGAGF